MKTAIIDWPLTPLTGWGGYGIQLAQALMEQGRYKPLLPARCDCTVHCDLHWQGALQHLEACSKGLRERLEQTEAVGMLPLPTKASLVFSPMGNHVPPVRFVGDVPVGVTFFECSSFGAVDLQRMREFPLVITGSRWNQAVLQRLGVVNARLVHQGIDPALFNPVPVPQLLQRSLVIFSGGKLEGRKGQDVVIAAFREFVRSHPDSLLIAAWGNVGDVGLSTIGLTPHVEGIPERGRPEAISQWLESNGVPSANVWVLPCVVNRQLPHLIKQADVAVFASRCEGGTNLMAMETLACGVPTLVSANTGHLDLIELGLDHCVPIGAAGLGQVSHALIQPYGGDPDGIWGETDPAELLECWQRLAVEKASWRQRGAAAATGIMGMSWRRSMAQLLGLIDPLLQP
jgi:glycosyltransferase involved in cell wall biosynthesis